MKISGTKEYVNIRGENARVFTRYGFEKTLSSVNVSGFVFIGDANRRLHFWNRFIWFPLMELAFEMIYSIRLWED